jgi:hypothetical protein
MDTYHSLYQSNLVRRVEAGRKKEHLVFPRFRQRLCFCVQPHNGMREEGDTVSGFNGLQYCM